MNNNSVYKEAAIVSIWIFVLGLIEFLCFTLFYRFGTDILFGVLYGCAFASFNFFHIAYSVRKSMHKSEDKAKVYMSGTYSIRMFLTAVMIFVAAKAEMINLWAAIIPLAFVRIAVSIITVSRKRGENI